MRILAFDTATEACSAALLIDNELISRFEIAPRRHAELILPMIEEVMVQAEIKVTQLDAIAVGCGPGSFTGVRIATGVAQGIAFAADLPVIPISTLAAIALGIVQAHNKEHFTHIAVAIDARMQEVYWGLYRADPELGVRALDAECVIAPEQVPTVELTEADRCFGAGSGWLSYSEILCQHLPVADYQGDCYPSAAAIARLAAIAWQQGKTVPAEQALPVYLRDRVTHQKSS